MSTVCAVVVGDGPGAAAVSDQDRAAEHVLRHSGSWRGAGRDGVAAGAGGIWLVDGAAEPRRDALGALLAVAERPDGLPAPVLVSSKVVGPNGELDPAAAPWPPLHDRHG